MSIKYRTSAYFSDFTCLGADCSDTCCKDWEVKLDREHFEILKDVMQQDPLDKKLFENNILLNNRTISGDHDFAHIVMSQNGMCAMLDGSGLCTIHKNHGPDVLGNVCTMFPRVVSRCDETIELSGSLSCPEVVRKCINSDNPLKLVPFKTSELPRSKNYPIQREIISDGDNFYEDNFANVRKVLLNLMAKKDRDLDTRLFALMTFSHKISAFYHRGCAVPQGSTFQDLLNEFSNDKTLEKIEEYIRDYEVDSPIGVIVAHSILAIKLQQEPGENISKLYSWLLEKLPGNDEIVNEIFNLLPSIRSKLPGSVDTFIEEAIARYVMNCLYREWFISMPDVFTYMQMLLVRVMILRMLIYLVVGDLPDKQQAEDEIVYVIYNFARNIDQNLEFLKVVFNALSEQSMINFDFSPAFIRIFSLQE